MKKYRLSTLYGQSKTAIPLIRTAEIMCFHRKIAVSLNASDKPYEQSQGEEQTLNYSVAKKRLPKTSLQDFTPSSLKLPGVKANSICFHT